MKKKNTKNKNKIILLIIQLLLAITLVLYLLGRPQGLPVWLFWPIIWAIIIIAITGYRLPEKQRIIMLILLEIALLSIPVLSLPEVFQSGRDAIFESQYASLITREQRWDPSLGTGLAENYYGHNPILHFVLAFLSLTTGLSPFFLTKYIFITILRIVFVLAAYLLISTIVNRKNSAFIYFSTIIFMATPRLMFMGVSRRLIAAIFVMFALYVLFKSQTSSKKIWTILFFILSPLIIISDHSISYLFMIVLASTLIITLLTNKFSKIKIFKSNNFSKKAWHLIYLFALIMIIISGLRGDLISYVVMVVLVGILLIVKLRNVFNDVNFFKKHKIRIPDLFLKFSFFIGVWVLWNLVITKVLIRVDMAYAKNLLKFISAAPFTDSLSGADLIEKASVNINYLYENLIIYASQIVFIALGIIGFLLFVKYLNARKETDAELKTIPLTRISLFLYLGLFSIVMYFFVGLLMFTSWDVVPQVFLWFFSLFISIFVMYSLHTFKNKFPKKRFSSTIIVLIILLLYTGGLLLGYVPTIVNRAPNEDIILEFVDSKNQQLYSSGAWLKDNAKNNSVVLGDPSVFDIYSGFFEFNVVTDGYARDLYLLNDTERVNYFLQESVFFGYYIHTIKKYEIDYVVINNKLFEYPSHLIGDPLDPIIKKNFDKSYLDKMYDNNVIQIYQNYLE